MAANGASLRSRRPSIQQHRNSNQVTVRPPHRCQPHRPASPATSRRPRPPSASPSAARNSGAPGPPWSVTSTRTIPLLAVTVTVTVPSGAPDRLCRRLLLNSSLTRRIAESLHGCAGPSTSPVNARTTRARSARPASVMPSRPAVRAENVVHGSEQQGCSLDGPTVMITDHVPAARVPPNYAGRSVAAPVPA